MEQLLNLKDAMHFLNVSKSTLHRWDKQGKLVPIRTIGKHRRYRLCDLQKFAGIDSETVDDKQTDIRVVTYSRCSSTDQKQHGDIERQSMRNVEYAVKKGYNIVEIIKDCGSGINDKRKGFMKLCNLVVSHKIDRVIIEHKDRLTRFQYNLIEFFFNNNGVEIEIIDKKETTYQDELVNDMMMLLASFSGKLYSMRGKQNKKLKKNKQ